MLCRFLLVVVLLCHPSACAGSDKAKHARELEAKLRKQLGKISDPNERNRKLEAIAEMLNEKQESLLKAAGLTQDNLNNLMQDLFADYGMPSEEEPDLEDEEGDFQQQDDFDQDYFEQENDFGRQPKKEEQDHYKVLGLDRVADAAAIKRAYRKLALSHHPDKASPQDREAANVLFRQIALAYEILSNPTVKQRYDQTGSSESEYNQNLDPNDKYYMSPEVERQQVRPKEVRSFKQFIDMATNRKTGKAQKSMLVALVNAQDQQCLEFAAFGIKFPYPFAGWQELHFGVNSSGLNLWWEDVMQTFTVQEFDQDLVELFQPDRCPTFIFVQKGKRLSDFTRLPYEVMDAAPNNDVAGAFVGWVWEQMHTVVTVRNAHHSPIELFEMQRGGEDNVLRIKVLQPGEKLRHKTAVSFELFAREENTEGYTLSKNAVLASLSVMDWNFRAELSVHTRCADSHGDCPRWIENGSCEPSAETSLAMTCARSCGLCTAEDDPDHRCRDRASPCEVWKEGGFCSSSPERMQTLCPMSCGQCSKTGGAHEEL